MTKNDRNMFVGLSGFSYPAWKGTFYPKELKSEQFLEYYASKFNSVEINSSFYAAPNINMIKSWNTKTPDNFRFSFKAPRQITHIMKLGKGSWDPANRLAITLEPLGKKLGPVLFQLPPFSKQDLSMLQLFLESTLSVEKKVFEFRHESWLNDSTYDLLDKYNVGFCIAESEDMRPVFKTTGKIAYFRLRNESYQPDNMDIWKDKISKISEKTLETYVYLRHDETGNNALLAERLLD